MITGGSEQGGVLPGSAEPQGRRQGQDPRFVLSHENLDLGEDFDPYSQFTDVTDDGTDITVTWRPRVIDPLVREWTPRDLKLAPTEDRRPEEPTEFFPGL